MFIQCFYPRRSDTFAAPFCARGITDLDVLSPSNRLTLELVQMDGGPLKFDGHLTNNTASTRPGVRQWVFRFKFDADADKYRQAGGKRFVLLVKYNDVVKLRVENVRLPRHRAKKPADTEKVILGRPVLENIGGLTIDSPTEDSTVESHDSLTATGIVDPGKITSATLEYLNQASVFDGFIVDDGDNDKSWVASFSCAGMTGSQPVRLTVRDNQSPVRTATCEFTLTDAGGPGGGPGNVGGPPPPP